MVFWLTLVVLSPLHSRYIVIKKLGWGHFSTVWMVKDLKAQAAGKGDHFYALKVQKSAEHYTEAAMDEVELLDCIAQKQKHEASLVVADGGAKDPEGMTALEMVDHGRYLATLHDSFFHTGPNGRHMCMVFSMLGVNLLSVIKAFNYRGIPIEVVKKMIQGVCKGLDFLHRRCKTIHTDLKPENVLLQFPEQFDDDVGTTGVAALSLDSSEKIPGVAQTIEQIENLLKDPNLPADERKKLKKKLKRKRQKEKKRAAGNAGSNDADEEEDDTENMEDSDDSEESQGGEGVPKDAPTSPLFSAFTDFTMEKMISSASALIGSPFSGEGVDPATESHSMVKRRLTHSRFVLCNFGPHVSEVDATLVQMMRENVVAHQVGEDELKTSLSENGGNGGIAEIQFLLRSFETEEVLANSISLAFGGLDWEADNRDEVERNW